MPTAYSNLNKKINVLNEAIQIQPNHIDLISELAQTHFQLKNYSLAKNYYDLLILRRPKNPFYLIERVDIDLIEERFDLALTRCQLAIQLEPFYLFAHYRLAEIYFFKKDTKKVTQSLKNIKTILNANLKPTSDYDRRLLNFDKNLLINNFQYE